MTSPAPLLEQVRNTAPFLFPLQEDDAYQTALRAAEQQLPDTLEGYFRLCLACHYATVATFVPTDVDTKIRGILWRETRDLDVLRSMAAFALSARHWDVTPVSKRNVTLPGERPVSGHHGEWFSVMLGAAGRIMALGDDEYAAELTAAVDDELQREIRIFLKALQQPGLEIETLHLAMSITHNLGDIDQGISFSDGRVARELKARFGRLAHENTAPYGGMYQFPALLYKELLAPEGHRHYPLRSVKPLRVSHDLLLPLGLFLDDWGATLATSPSLHEQGRAEVLDALIRGCRKVAGQLGYFRAIAGFRQASQRNFDTAVADLPAAARRELKDPALQQRIAVAKVSFESPFRKRVARMRDNLRSQTGVRTAR